MEDFVFCIVGCVGDGDGICYVFILMVGFFCEGRIEGGVGGGDIGI